jgi:hypothetical protein
MFLQFNPLTQDVIFQKESREVEILTIEVLEHIEAKLDLGYNLAQYSEAEKHFLNRATDLIRLDTEDIFIQHVACHSYFQPLKMVIIPQKKVNHRDSLKEFIEA